MRVLQINVLGSTLSTGRTTRELHHHLQKRGEESYIACPTNRDSDDVFTFSHELLVKIDYVMTKYSGLDARHSVFPTLKLIRYIKKIKPDIVHLRVLHTHCLHIGMLLSYLARQNIATVVTLHDFWYMTGMCCHYVDYPCDRWKTGCGNCPGIPTDPHEKKFDRTAYLWRCKKKEFSGIPRLAVVGVSDWVTRSVKHSLLSEAAIIRRIYNWIDLETFTPRDGSQMRRKLGLEGKYVVLAVAATWVKGYWKGLEHYIALAEQMPEHYRIVLVGEMQYTGELPANIISIPRTDDEDKLAIYYSMADVYLNLSRAETFGKVSAEAVACGTPLIAYGVTANPEIVPPGAGATIPELSVEVILRALSALEQQPKERYTPICRQFAQRHFDMETNAESYLSLYNELLDM